MRGVMSYRAGGGTRWRLGNSGEARAFRGLKTELLGFQSSRVWGFKIGVSQNGASSDLAGLRSDSEGISEDGSIWAWMVWDSGQGVSDFGGLRTEVSESEVL